MKNEQLIEQYLQELKLPWTRQHYEALAQEAAQKQWTPTQYLHRILEGESLRRRENRVQRRLQNARFPALKTLDTFDWSWPKKINRELLQHLARLTFLNDHTNLLLLGGVGLGKTHLATALGYAACLEGYCVLFTTATDMVNALCAAQAQQRLKTELKRYTTPQLLILDELGYIPLDQQGADLLFQVISARYERGSIILTSNKAFKQWPAIFHNDATLTSALLDRLLHHAQPVLIEGNSYRMKEQVQP